MAKFKVGDKVRVIDSGQSYENYTGWAKQHNLHRFRLWLRVGHGEEGTVVAVGPHLTNTASGVIVGLQTQDGSQTVFGEDGLELVQEANPYAFPELKPFMRVKVACGHTYIVCTRADGSVALVREDNFHLGMDESETFQHLMGNGHSNYKAVAVYTPPTQARFLLDPAYAGELIWSLEEAEKVQERAEQLAEAEAKVEETQRAWEIALVELNSLKRGG